MDKLIHYQVEQKRILEQIKIQISQDLNLAEIIQTAINRSCNFLNLDRLLIYQLNLPLELNNISEPQRTVDTVTYEAKAGNSTSTLYSQEEVCWRNLIQCKDRYYRGFSLAIDDVERHYATNSCLKSLMQKFQVKAKALAPIIVSEDLWGFVIAHQCLSTRKWHDREIKFLRQIAQHLEIAIEHHQSYQQLQHQKHILEQQVQTQAQQIKDALIAAEAASKSKHEFLGSMSHELRTPLTCVIGLSSTLLQWSSTKSAISLSPEKQQQYLHLIQQSGKHLLALIDNILEFSDVESGKHLLDIKQVSLSAIARQSLRMLQDSAKAKNIILSSEINLTIEEEYFLADEIRLKEILFNLLDNAIKFTPQNGKAILRIWREKYNAIFQIEDTGIGIADREVPLLFEKFKQIEHYRDRIHGGTGLGLALTKKLVELHGGNIEVESALGKGSTFTVYLPHKILFPPHGDRNSAITGQLQKTSQTIILVTEDEEAGTVICQFLNTIDCQVIWLMDSNVAMNQIELLQPKAIVIDSNFGYLAVNHLTRKIKEKSLTDSINLILLCEDIQCECDRLYSRYRVDEYLYKNMTPTEMVNKIDTFLK